MAKKCGVEWGGLFEVSRDHWREMVETSLDALLFEAAANMDGQINAKTAIVRVVEYIRRVN